MNGKKQTNWQNVNKWYGALVGEEGHYFHQHIVIPKSLRLLDIKSGDRVLDVACGQGVLERSIKQSITYLGVDGSKGLIEQAKQLSQRPERKFVVADASVEIPTKQQFNKAAIILAMQNMAEPEKVIELIGRRMENHGKLVIVLNHPCFRIPRQSSWQIDEKNKLEYRRINRYMTPLEIPINMHPGEKHGAVTWSYHMSLSDYMQMFRKNKWLVENIEEWTSDKSSEGKNSKQENRARSEFPMFLALVLTKTGS